MKKIFTIVLSAIAITAFSQTDSLKSPLKISGFLEIYYSYDFGNPQKHTRPDFAYAFTRHNEVSLNLGYIKANYETNNVRANLALMTGSYPNANLADEPGVLKNIYEANAGAKISKTKNIWIDAGILPSHIGFESAHSPSCLTLTRSILADNSPYFETGAAVSYTSDNEKWFLSGLVLNGWQRIQREEGNNAPAFGHQLTFMPNDKITLNSSSFIGRVNPDSVGQMRYFHNLYGQFQLSDKLELIAGFDIGAQQKAKASGNYNVWYSPVMIAKYAMNEKLGIAVRGEYYSDENQVVIETGTLNGFQTIGYSLNFDYNISDRAMWRIEGRGFSSKDKIFMQDNKPTVLNHFITTSLAITF